MKYRKKTVVIDAVQFKNNLKEVEEFIRYQVDGNYNDTGSLQEIIISTLEGDMTVIKGDWIIKDIKGELYPIKDGIFKSTYEKVEE